MYSDIFLKGLEKCTLLACAAGSFSIKFDSSSLRWYPVASKRFSLSVIVFSFITLFMFVRTAIYKHENPNDLGTFAVSYIFSLAALFANGMLVCVKAKNKELAGIFTDVMRNAKLFESKKTIFIPTQKL